MSVIKDEEVASNDRHLKGGLIDRPNRVQTVKRRRPGRRNLGGLLFMAPALVFVASMTAFPVYVAVTYSMYRTVGFERTKFVGLGNFTDLFRDPAFLTNVTASVTFVVGSLVLAGGLGTYLGFKLRHDTRTSKILRTVILIPWITSEIATGIMWQWMLNKQYGPVPYFAGLVGWDFPDVFATPGAAMVTIIFVNVWRSLAFPMIMTIASLQSVPPEVEEAAKVDGAGPLRTAWSITIPFIMPVTMVTMIILSFSYLNVVALILDMTGGGPVRSTEVLSLRLYREIFGSVNIGRASVISLTLILTNMLLAGAYYLTLARGRRFTTN